MGAEEFHDVVQKIKPPGLGDGGATRPPLIAQFDPALHQDADAAALRERVLGEVVEKWIAARTLSDDQQMTLDDLRPDAVVGVDFVDANRLDERGAPEPVALREVLERLTARLAEIWGEQSSDSWVGAAVLVLGCRFSGIDLSEMTLPVEMALIGCRIDGDVLCQKTVVHGHVYLNDTHIGRNVDMESVQINGRLLMDRAEVHGDVKIVKGDLTGELQAANLKVQGVADLSGTQAKQGFELPFITVRGNLSLNGCSSRQGIALKDAWIGGKALLERISIDAVLDLHQARIHGDLTLNQLQRASALRLQHLRLGGDFSVKEAKIQYHVHLDHAGIRGAVDLSSAKIAGDFSLNDARVGLSVGADRSVVAGAFEMRRTHIGGNLALFNIVIGCGLELEEVEAAGSVWLRDAIMLGAITLPKSVVVDHVVMSGCHIGGACDFARSRIGGEVRFENNIFLGPVCMHDAALSDCAVTGTPSLLVASWHETSRNSATFGRRPPPGVIQCWEQRTANMRLQLAHLFPYIETQVTASNLLQRLWKRVHNAYRFLRLWFRFKEDLDAVPNQFWQRVWWVAVQRQFASEAHWGKVRAFGELAILSRASNVALIGVPLLAGLWPIVRDLVQWFVERQGILASHAIGQATGVAAPTRTAQQAYLDTNLPWVWGALFFAAVCAVLGRVLYQAQCPQVIREHSREDLIARRREEFQRLRESDAAARGSREDFPEDAQVHLSLLEEALKRVQEAGTDVRLVAFRHRNLVKVNGRTYWLPSSVKEFDDQPQRVKMHKMVLERIAGQQHSDVYERFSDRSKENGDEEKGTAPAWIPRTRLEVIAIMAGADAEYDMEARRNRFWACVSHWFFILAAILIGLVLWHQAILIFWEIGAGLGVGPVRTMHEFLFYLGARCWLYVLAAMFLGLIILMVLDAVFGRDPFTDPIVLKQNIHRDIDRALGKGSF